MGQVRTRLQPAGCRKTCRHTEGNWFPDTVTPLHPFRMRSSLRPHPKKCPPGTTWQQSIYRFWSDNATTARNLQSGTVTWGGCFPHMQILHKGMCPYNLGVDAVHMETPPQETQTTSGRWSFGRASTFQACQKVLKWAPTSLTPSCTTSVRAPRMHMHAPSRVPQQIPATTGTSTTRTANTTHACSRAASCMTPCGRKACRSLFATPLLGDGVCVAIFPTTSTTVLTSHRGRYVPPPVITIPSNWTPYALDPVKCGYVMYCPRCDRNPLVPTAHYFPAGRTPYNHATGPMAMAAPATRLSTRRAAPPSGMACQNCPSSGRALGECSLHAVISSLAFDVCAVFQFDDPTCVE